MHLSVKPYTRDKLIVGKITLIAQNTKRQTAIERCKNIFKRVITLFECERSANGTGKRRRVRQKIRMRNKKKNALHILINTDGEEKLRRNLHRDSGDREHSENVNLICRRAVYVRSCMRVL